MSYVLCMYCVCITVAGCVVLHVSRTGMYEKIAQQDGNGCTCIIVVVVFCQ